MRTAARVLLVDQAERILLIRTRDPERPAAADWWEVPGGGLKPGEDAIAAAARELAEETGFIVPAERVGPPLWRRETIFSWRGRHYHQRETLHVAYWDGPEVAVAPARPTAAEDGAILGHAWWPVANLRTSGDHFFPGSLPLAAPRMLAGQVIDEPFERWQPAARGADPAP